MPIFCSSKPPRYVYLFIPTKVLSSILVVMMLSLLLVTVDTASNPCAVECVMLFALLFCYLPWSLATKMSSNTLTLAREELQLIEQWLHLLECREKTQVKVMEFRERQRLNAMLSQNKLKVNECNNCMLVYSGDLCPNCDDWCNAHPSGRAHVRPIAVQDFSNGDCVGLLSLRELR